jgi:hypothetical protein
VSLWADPLPQPEREPDVVARVLPDEPEEPDGSPPPSEAPQRRPRGMVIGVLAAVILVLLATARSGGGTLAVEDVPSSWDEVPMTCRTARFEERARAIELFSCRALGIGSLPPGVYRSPSARWNSDITRREARANGMTISPEEMLKGWAIY